MNLKRRTFLQGIASATALAGFGGISAFAQSGSVRFAWWGNPDRDRRTYEVLDLLGKENPSIAFSGETTGYADFFTRLATQAAGSNMPDVIQHGLGFREYVERGLILPLDEYVGSSLDISHLDQDAIDAFTLDGKLWCLSIGANSIAAVYNTRLFEEAGLGGVDAINWTWDDIKAYAMALQATLPQGVYAIDDPSNNWDGLRIYLGQRGIMNPYSDDGKSFAFDAATLADFWKFTKELRDAGITPPGSETAAAGKGLSELNVVLGKTAISFAYSNQVVGIQQLMQDKVGLGMAPHLPGGQPGQWIQPSQCIALTRDVRDKEAAVTYMNHFINEPQVANILGIERGIPAVSTIREALSPSLTETEQVVVSYFDAIQGKVRPLIPPQPAKALEAEEVFARNVVAVLLDRATIEDTAAQVVNEGNAILRRP